MLTQRKATAAKPNARFEKLVVTATVDEVLLYDTEKHHIHHLNATTAADWRPCDGKHTVVDLAREAGAALGADMDEATVRRALTKLDDAGLLKQHLADELRMSRMSRRTFMQRTGVAGAIAVPAIVSTTAAVSAVSPECPEDCPECPEGQACVQDEDGCFLCKTIQPGICGYCPSLRNNSYSGNSKADGKPCNNCWQWTCFTTDPGKGQGTGWNWYDYNILPKGHLYPIENSGCYKNDTDVADLRSLFGPGGTTGPNCPQPLISGRVSVAAVAETEVPQTGNLTVTLIDGGGALVGGAVFQLLQVGAVVATSSDPDGTGYTSFADLSEGDYTVHLSAAPDGVSAGDVAVTIVAGDNSVTVTATVAAPPEPEVEQPTAGTAWITAVNANSGAPVLNFCVSIDGAGGYFEACDTGSGTASFGDVLVGDYTVSLLSQADGGTAAGTGSVNVPAGDVGIGSIPVSMPAPEAPAAAAPIGNTDLQVTGTTDPQGTGNTDPQGTSNAGGAPAGGLGSGFLFGNGGAGGATGGDGDTEGDAPTGEGGD